MEDHFPRCIDHFVKSDLGEADMSPESCKRLPVLDTYFHLGQQIHHPSILLDESLPRLIGQLFGFGERLKLVIL